MFIECAFLLGPDLCMIYKCLRHSYSLYNPYSSLMFPAYRLDLALFEIDLLESVNVILGSIDSF